MGREASSARPSSLVGEASDRPEMMYERSEGDIVVIVIVVSSQYGERATRQLKPLNLENHLSEISKRDIRAQVLADMLDRGMRALASGSFETIN